MSVEVEFSNNFGKVKKEINNALVRKIERATIHLQGEVKKTLSGQRSGKHYRVPNTSKVYQASKAGEAPAVRTGDLRNSYKYKLRRTNVEVLGAVGSDLKKAVYLENGTSKMEPRPHFLVTYEKQRKAIKNILSERM